MLSFELKGGEPGEKPPDMERDLERLRDLSAQLSAAERQMLGDLLERMGAYLDSTGSAAALFAALTASAVSFLNHMAEDARAAHPELLEEADGALRTRILRKVRVPLVESGTELTLMPGVYETLTTTGGTDGERAEQATVLYAPAGGGAAGSIPLKAVALALAVEDAQEADVRALAYLYMHAAADVDIPGDEEIEAMASGRYKWPHAVSGGPGGAARRRTPKQDTARPESYPIGLSKLQSSLPDCQYDVKEVIDVSGKGEALPATVAVLLSMDDDSIATSRPVTGYDLAVHSAVASLWVAGNRYFTPAQAYKAMTGRDSDPGPAALKRVEESLDKQCCTRVTIDMTEEARRRDLNVNGFEASKAELTTNMIWAAKLRVETRGGGEVMGYLIKEAPIFYAHDNSIGQVRSVSVRYLAAASEAVKPVEQNIVTRDYLFRRIEAMKNSPKLSRRIRYEALYKVAGINEESRTTTQRRREAIGKMLDALRAEGYIKGWDEYRDKGSNGKMAGVEIRL